MQFIKIMRNGKTVGRLVRVRCTERSSIVRFTVIGHGSLAIIIMMTRMTDRLPALFSTTHTLVLALVFFPFVCSVVVAFVSNTLFLRSFLFVRTMTLTTAKKKKIGKRRHSLTDVSRLGTERRP